jgi:hypothetical protein
MKMLVYFMAIWYILRHFEIFYGHLVFLRSFGIFFPFRYVVPRQIWQLHMFTIVAPTVSDSQNSLFVCIQVFMYV